MLHCTSCEEATIGCEPSPYVVKARGAAAAAEATTLEDAPSKTEEGRGLSPALKYL